MTRVIVSSLAMLWLAGLGCGQAPGTSVRLALLYDDALGLDSAEVTLDNRTESGPIAHELLLVVPDDLAGVVMPMEVWARKDGRLSAYGTTTAVPELDITVPASLTLTACTPACNGDMLTTCTGPVVACGLGCSEDGDAHCIPPKPSNGVDAAEPRALRTSITISADTTFDSDTGAITGGLVRAGGTGVDAGVGYVQSAGLGGGAPLGIFVFHNLTVESTAKVQLTGTRAVVLLVGETARIAGALDLSGGRGVRSAAGPGGGAGGSLAAPAGGCGPGGPGSKGTGASNLKDSGGAGGGAGTAGGAGGSTTDTTLPIQPGGSAGQSCLALDLEPLQGGGGGGSGTQGGGVTAGVGGGGGGALQITALVSLEITGTIDVGGAGGEGGVVGAIDAGGGAGGGAGGAILIEAPIVTIATGAILAANGGGGGAGGNDMTSGAAGQPGALSLIPARGGVAGGVNVGNGGAGAAESIAAVGGFGGGSNCGGGGGGAGAIVIRARTLTSTGTFSPGPVETDVQQLRAGSLPGGR